MAAATLFQYTWRLFRRSIAYQFQVFRSFYFLIDIIKCNRNFHGNYNFSRVFFSEINLLQGDTVPLKWYAITPWLLIAYGITILTKVLMMAHYTQSTFVLPWVSSSRMATSCPSFRVMNGSDHTRIPVVCRSQEFLQWNSRCSCRPNQSPPPPCR